jgi:glycosyltransferase involved in cell wall biosynthesis
MPSHKKKIVVVSWHPGDSDVQIAGGYKRTYEILNHFPKEQEVVCIDKFPSYLRSLHKNNITIIEYKLPNYVGHIVKINFTLGKLLERLLTSFIIIQIILKHYRNQILYVPYSELPHLTLSAIVTKWLAGNRVVLTNLNINNIWLDNIINKFLHRFSDLNITISKALQDDLNRYGITCSIINPVGIDIQYAKKIPPQQKIYDGIYIGRHVVEKGVLDVLAITKELNNHKEFNVITLGNIPDYMTKVLSTALLKLRLSKNVSFRGIVGEQEKYKLIKQSKVCIFPSYREGWAIVPQEALSCYVPVVAYDLPVYRENISQCAAVILVPEGDKKGFSEAVLTFLNMPEKELKAKMKQSMSVISQFDWGTIAKQEYNYIIGI